MEIIGPLCTSRSRSTQTYMFHFIFFPQTLKKLAYQSILQYLTSLSFSFFAYQPRAIHGF